MSSRRRKRRLDRTDRPSEDVDDLFDLLLEQATPSTPARWFEAPWRSPLNAIRLGGDLLEATNSETATTVGKILAFARGIDRHDFEGLYWEAQDLKELARTGLVSSDRAVAVLELIQKFASRSDGGGVGYNGPLLRICEGYLQRGGALEVIEPPVRRWRGRDIVGDGLEDGGTQKRLRAFNLAWNRGLFKLASLV